MCGMVVWVVDERVEGEFFMKGRQGCVRGGLGSLQLLLATAITTKYNILKSSPGRTTQLKDLGEENDLY